MHKFSELILQGTNFTLHALNKAYMEMVNELQHHARTSSVKGLQMIRFQKAIIATGMFSLFEAELQQEFSCKKGFPDALKILTEIGEVNLKNRFNYFILAINVLKHGEGKSYKALVAESNSLPFRILLPGENFFFEGDVSEINTLIEVDNKFVINCAKLIQQVFDVLQKN